MNNIELKEELGNLENYTQRQHNLNNNISMENTKSNKKNAPTFNEVYDEAQPLESLNQHKYAQLKELDIELHPELRIGNWYDKKVLIYPTYNVSKESDIEKIEVKQINGQRICEASSKRSFSDISGTFYIIGCKPDEIGNYKKVYCCEGLATGEKVYLGSGKETPVLCYLSKSYFRKFLENFRCAYPYMKMEIGCDIDAIEGIEGVVKKLGCTDIWIAKPTLNEEEEVEFRKYQSDLSKQPDFWDLWKVGDENRIKEELEKIYEIEQKPVLPCGFKYKDDGLYYQKNDGGTKDIFISSRIDVIAQTSDEKSQNWGRLVEFKDKNNIVHREAISMDTLSSDCSTVISALLNNGMLINHVEHTAKKRLIQFIQDTEVYKNATCINKTGWYKNHYILPHFTIPNTDEIYLQNDKLNNYGYDKKATFEEWQENVAKYCEGNSRLVLALSMAFTAPLLPILGSESYGINLIGSSSIGKKVQLLK